MSPQLKTGFLAQGNLKATAQPSVSFSPPPFETFDPTSSPQQPCSRSSEELAMLRFSGRPSENARIRSAQTNPFGSQALVRAQQPSDSPASSAINQNTATATVTDLLAPSDRSILEGESIPHSLPDLNHPTDFAPPEPLQRTILGKRPSLSDSAFLRIIPNILESPSANISRSTPPLFQFGLDRATAVHNSSVFASFQYDIALALQAHHNTPLGMGSEFRPSTALHPLLCRHPLWPRLRPMLDYGAVVPLRPISAENRQSDLDYHLARGNHMSAKQRKDKLFELLHNDIIHGFCLPLTLDCLQHINNASIAPLGIQEQATIDEFGNRKIKWRMTHDQTFPGPSGLSVNRRTIKEELNPCMFGWVLQRIIMQITSLCLRHPTTPILIGKYDLKAAYRRAHLSPTTATECLTVIDDTLFIALRMTFGGAAFPALWSCHSEVICDLANDILQCPAWDHRSICSPLQHLLPPPDRNYPDAPFAPAFPLAVDIPVNDRGSVEVYLDDLPPVCVDIGDNAERCAAVVPLALHIFGRPMALDEPIPRDELLSVTKALGEGRMSK